MSIHIDIGQHFLIQIHFSKGNRTRWVRLWWFQNHLSSRFCFNFSKVSKFLKFHVFKLFIKFFELFESYSEFLLRIWLIEMLREYRAKFQLNWSNLSRKSYIAERRSQNLRFFVKFSWFLENLGGTLSKTVLLFQLFTTVMISKWFKEFFYKISAQSEHGKLVKGQLLSGELMEPQLTQPLRRHTSCWSL